VRCLVRVYLDGWVCRGVGVEVGCLREPGSYGILVDVGSAGGEVFRALDEVIGVAPLPGGEVGGEAVGETAFDRS
jgi:hypothetical protein